MDAENRQAQLDELEALRSVLREDRLRSFGDCKNPDELISGMVQVSKEVKSIKVSTLSGGF